MTQSLYMGRRRGVKTLSQPFTLPAVSPSTMYFWR
jgi:hypothetical protein